MGRPLNLHNYGDRSDVAVRDQIVVQAYINGGVNSCYLLQQKNRNKFHVVIASGAIDPATGKPYTAICQFVDSGSPTAGQMSCQATLHGGGTFYVSRITNRYVYDFLAPSNAAPNKYFWGFVDQAPDAPIDYPTLGFAVLPSASRPADTNLAP